MKKSILRHFENKFVNWTYTPEERLAYNAFCKVYTEDIARMIIDQGHWTRVGDSYIANITFGKPSGGGWTPHL